MPQPPSPEKPPGLCAAAADVGHARLMQSASASAIEAAHSNFWHKYIGPEGVIIGIDSFGASAPGNQLFERYGFTLENIEEVVEGII